MKSDKKIAILISLVLLASALALVLPASADSSNQEAFFERGTIFKQAHLKHADFDRGHLHSTDERSNLYGTEMGIQEVDVQDAQLGNGYYFEVYPWGAYPMPDVTYDNKTDVLVNLLQIAADGDFEWRVIAKDGKTGKHLWEESEEYEYTEEGLLLSYGTLNWDWPYMVQDYYFLDDYYDYYRGWEFYYMDFHSWDWDWYWDWYWNWDGDGYGDWYKYSKYAPGIADMNGDGKGDVLVWIGEYDPFNNTETITLIAKNGTTGEHLWEEPIDTADADNESVGLFGYGVPDMNGDGNADVLVIDWYYNDSSGGEWERLIAKNGTTGEHLWEENATDVTEWYSWVDLWGYAVPDLSCDGKPDVLVWRVEHNVTPGEKRHMVMVKEGATGEQLWEENITADLKHFVGIWAYSVPDLSGDGKTDVLVRTWLYNQSTKEEKETIIAKNGTSGDHLWEENVTADANHSVQLWAFGIPDLDGDTKTDVLVRILEENKTIDEQNWTVIAKNGTSGDHLWEMNVTADANHSAELWACAVPDLNGDGKTDVLVKIREKNSTTGEENWTLIAKNGTSGDHLWMENHTKILAVSSDWLLVDAYGYPDMNGDGKTDVLVKVYEWNETTDELNVTVIVKDGTNGTHIWEEPIILESDELWVDAYAVPDMSGDGTTDVAVGIYVWDYYYGDEPKNFTISVKDGTNGTHLWEESITSEDLYWAYGSVVPDIDGDDKPDVLFWYLEVNEATYTITTTTIAKKGTNGTHLWEEAISSTLTANLTGVTFEPDKGTFCEPLTAIDASELLPGAIPLPPVNFSYGFFSFTICGLENGTTVNVTITLPGPVPVGVQYWKYGPTPGDPTDHWYQLPVFDDDGDNVIIIQLTDGGLGDDDLTANGVIVDDGGPGTPRATQVPILMPLGIVALIGLLSIIVTSTLLKKRKS